jgi:hypothetical protein
MNHYVIPNEELVKISAKVEAYDKLHDLLLDSVMATLSGDELFGVTIGVETKEKAKELYHLLMGITDEP